jgi:hypothetical protein
MPFSGTTGTSLLRLILVYFIGLYSIILLAACYLWAVQHNEEIRPICVAGLATLQTFMTATVGYIVKREQSSNGSP